MALILLIDDHAALRQTLRRILLGEGHEVLEAANGRVGMTLFERHNPTLVITDILMPDQDGIETILDMRRRDAGAKIIAMSGGEAVRQDLYLDAARKLGADEVVRKPFRADEIVALVDRLLGARVYP